MGHHILNAKELGEREGKLLKIVDVPAYIHKVSGVLVKNRVVYTWIHKGKRRYTNHLLKLRATQRCGIWFTTEGWVDKFLRGLNE